jgi:hypothetical protein
MGRKLFLWFVWLGFILYVLLLAPPLQPDTLKPFQALLTGHIVGINPVIISLFSMVGIWLLIYSCLIFVDGRMQRIPAWAFILASLGTGTIALIPYLALREPDRNFSGPKDAWLELMEARSTGAILTISSIVLLCLRTRVSNQ